MEMLYSEARGTWNLFVNGEWYAEGNYEEISDMMANHYANESEVEDYE